MWRTDTDVIEHGQWLKGRVYERRSDVSADGTLFCAFVRQSGMHPEKRADTWIALSRPPFFSALAVWLVGGTYHTGGFFPDRSSVWLGFSDQTTPDVGTVPSWLRFAAPRAIPYIDGTPEWPDRTVHFNRLLRGGWTLEERAQHDALWKRPHPQAGAVLQMLQSYEGPRKFGGPYSVDYSLWDETAGRERRIGEAAWADFDHRGRLIVARDGRLLDWPLDGDPARPIADFNDQAPDPQPPPADMLAWPAAPGHP